MRWLNPVTSARRRRGAIANIALYPEGKVYCRAVNNSLRGIRPVAASLIAACTALSASLATATVATASTVARASTSVHASTSARATASPASRAPSLAQLAMLEQRARGAVPGQPGQQGTITGSVTGPDGQRIAGACVTAVSGSRSVTTAAAPDGTFRLASLAVGSYALEYRDCAAAGRYQTAWSGGSAALSNAARVQVSAGQARHVPAVMLRPVNPAAAIAARQASFQRALAAGSRSLSAAAAAKTGQISGKVTGKGKPLGGICVLVAAVSGPHAYGAQTAKNGAYTIRGVAPGRYDVIFDPLGECPTRANWLQQTYKGDNSPYGGKATAVRIKAGHKTSGISANLRLGGEISGTVTGKSGTKLRGICVFADAKVGRGQYVTYQDHSAANGSYQLHALFPGKYTLFFEIGCGSRGANYAPATHRPVKIGLGQHRPVNEKLAPGASITGKVTLTTSSGTSLGGICVGASNASGTVGDFTSTNSKGEYRAIGLTGGRFQLYFSPGCNNNGNYTSASLTADTTAGRQTSNVDAILQVGATISGTITDSASQPVSGMCVEIVGNDNASANVGLDNGGNYVINQLAAGTYQVGFISGCGNSGSYAPNWYDNQQSENTATPITLATGATDDEVDAVLQPGATITGKVTNSAGRALSGVCVSASTPGAADFGPVSEAQTGRSGTYTIPDLAPGQYLINFGCGLEQRYANEWFPAAPDASVAEQVSAPPGRTANINAALPPAGSIKGVVTGKAGHPLSGVCVFAVSTKDTAVTGSSFATISIVGGGGELGFTGSRGTYQIQGLEAGSYRVLFEPCTGSLGYAEQWYRHTASAQAATIVKVRAGKTTPGIDGRLVAGGKISGRVVNASGTPVRNICIVAIAGSTVGEAVTGKAGTYTIPALASGRYTVEFAPCANQNLVTVVTHVRVTAPHAKTGINATMHAGGSIAGTVKAASGQPVSESCVEIYSDNSAEPVGGAITGLDGTYRATGLAAGTYQVFFGDPQCLVGPSGLAPQWYDNESTQGSATGVPVTVGATTPSIDATLQPDGQITGTVSTGPSASPLAGICVTAIPQASGSLPVVAVTGTTGGYTLADLLPGDYTVRFSSGCGTTGYATQWYDGVTSQTLATPVPVGAGLTQSDINATLSKSS